MKCDICRAKLRVSQISLKCKCNKYVCNQHRFPDQHNCSYDFKSAYKSKLKRELVQVEADKILKI